MGFGEASRHAQSRCAAKEGLLSRARSLFGDGQLSAPRGGVATHGERHCRILPGNSGNRSARECRCDWSRPGSTRVAKKLAWWPIHQERKLGPASNPSKSGRCRHAWNPLRVTRSDDLRRGSADSLGMTPKKTTTLRDRRVNRFEVPPCRKCASPSVKVHDRTTDGLILSCMACDERWIAPKPKPTR
jgi:hypothetical protein